ncbi:hypothetical protein [Halodesulfovibrio marinisediminis]|uniref:Uncharacterized protein n=1 Tax=Halodesulfovibrio marinisediminis DSM 17456 TaxID=1121457 RepID=A0A1N6IRS4_9BACT|nr:hypothetical protein [Halodesulfovibrio marinisediminis]SIO34699.1 hypothetical protein SAMN02745161_2863 [Halodesulfovibrio marinisediminis DSM 17456]
MVRAKLIACNIAALMVLVALVLPTVVKAEGPCPVVVKKVCETTPVPPVDVVRSPTFTSPKEVTLYVPMNQMAINKALSTADERKVPALSTRRAVGRAVRRGTFVYPRCEWPVYAPEKYRVNPVIVRTEKP